MGKIESGHDSIYDSCGATFGMHDYWCMYSMVGRCAISMGLLRILSSTYFNMVYL